MKRSIKIVLLGALGISSLGWANAVDEAAICQSNHLVVYLKANMKTLPKTTAAPMRDTYKKGITDSEADLQKKLAAYEKANKKKFDVARCTSEAQLKNQQAQAKQRGKVADKDIAAGYTAVVSEPEAVRDYCTGRFQVQNSKRLPIASMPAAQQKEFRDAMAKLENQLAERRTAFQQRFKKPIDEKECAKMGL